MTVKNICTLIEEVAPLNLQESYDNAGLLIGNPQTVVSGILLCIDVTLDVINEAIDAKCNLIISHHPLIFSGLKRIIGQNEVQQCVIKAIKNDLSIYAAHTNMDNVLQGVSGKMADKIGLTNIQILQPKQNTLLKLVTYVPNDHANTVREALFSAGAGNIGNYDSCSFNSQGFGTFKANDIAQPFVGEANKLHSEPEIRLEIILPDYLQIQVVNALIQSHPYEQPAFDLIPLLNNCETYGSGVVGNLYEAEDELIFLNRLKTIFNQPVIKHTALLGKKIKRVALCGGSGSSLLKDAIAAKADIFVSGDFKYHDFFNAENRIIVADIGHFESEQFTKDIFFEIITKKMPTFAVLIAKSKTNPINYL